MFAPRHAANGMTAVARAATSWLRDELSTLAPEQWETPNACGVWSVAEVVAHLAWGATYYVDLIRRALANDAAGLSGVDATMDSAAMHAWLAERASAHRRVLGDRVLDAYAETGRELVELFASLGPADWERTAFHPAGPRPVRQLLRMRIFELGLHGWDALHAVGRDAQLPPGIHPLFFDNVAARLAGRFVPTDSLPEPLRYLFVLTPPVPRTVHLVVHGDRFEVDPRWDESGSDAVLTLHPETFILLFTGRLRWRDALDADAIGVTGRQDLAADLAAWFR